MSPERYAEVRTEILNKVAVLEDLINVDPVPPDVKAALEDLKAAAQTLDDVVPDVS